MKNLSLSKKIIFGFLASGFIPALLISTIVYKEYSESSREEAFKKLIAARESKGFQIENLYKTMFGQVSSLAQNSSTIEAMTEFNSAYKAYDSEVNLPVGFVEKNEDFYVSQFGKRFNETNTNLQFEGTSNLFSKLNTTSQKFQYTFISNNGLPLGEKDGLIDSKDNSAYSRVHKKFHSTFRTYLQKFEYYDIFLVSADTGEVIYSVFKELDFATSLKTGPYANSKLAAVHKSAMSAKDQNDVFVTEVDKYYPSYMAPAQFISAPIYQGDKLIGSLVFQIPLAKIDAITTGENKWVEQGFGESGESYIVGADKTMRSVSRFLVEDPDSFFKTMSDINVSDKDVNYMKAKSTSVLGATVDTVGTRSATMGETGEKIFPDYRNVNVLSAYKPLSIAGLNWFLLSEMDEAEALLSLKQLEFVIYMLIAASLVLISLTAFFFSKNVSNQLVKLSRDLEKSSDFVLNASHDIANNSGKLSAATNEQASSLQESSSSINEISAMVTRSSESALKTKDLALNSEKIAEKGIKSIQSVKTKMDNINSSNKSLVRSVEENNEELAKTNGIIQEIATKTQVINDIVFQTKLLSFNASVEAARAGEHGKGFSVVAEEIGALAEMSGTAAAEITELLDRSTAQVSETVNTSREKMKIIIKDGEEKLREGSVEIGVCGDSLDDILSSFKEVNLAITDVASSSKEQATGVKEITLAIQQLDAVTHQNTNISQQSSIKADELKEQSTNLSNIVSNIQQIVFGMEKIDKNKPTNKNNIIALKKRNEEKKKAS